MPFFQGEKVTLRAMEPEDLDLLYGMENASETWLVTNTNVPYSKALLKQYIEQSAGDLFTDRQLRLIVEERAMRRPVGVIDLSDFQPIHARAEIGLSIAAAERGKGYGREATVLLCDYAFQFLHLKQVVAYIAATNRACLHLYRSLGFQPCGLCKQWWRTGGAYQDVYLLQKVRED